MPPREAIKDHFLEQNLFHNRALLSGALVVLAMLAVLGRLVYLQLLSHGHFTTLSHNNRLSLIPLPPPRGLIYDRNGVVLAQNLPAYRLEITPEQARDVDETLERLASLLEVSDSDRERFRKTLHRKQPFEGVPLVFNLTDEQVARFAVNRHLFPGVEIEARLTRHYPLGGRAAHVLGYVGRIDERDLSEVDVNNYQGTSHTGKLGIEKFYEDLLHGQVGYQQVEVNAQGRTLRVLRHHPPVPGGKLTLTIDITLQRVAEEALEGYNGAVVAMDPRTGDILALASMPTYDPNLFVNGISSADYAALRDDSSRPLFNRALTGQYPPGSTIKPLVGLAGLEYDVIWAEKMMFAGGYYTLPNDSRRYRDWKRWGHGMVNLEKSITQSCDVYFYDLSYKLGIDRIHGFLTRFGLGTRSGVDTTGEAEGLLPSREWKERTRGMTWFPGETLITGIGQGYMLTTPLQLASLTSTIAMRGMRVRPHLRHHIAESTPRTHPTNEPLSAVELREEMLWEQVISAMVNVVHKPNGTARRIGLDAPYQMAGKTGTAQVFGLKQDEEYDEEKIDLKLRDHALFIAFAPADQPRIAVAVVVENGGSGGAVAAPVARRVMDHYLLRSS